MFGNKGRSQRRGPGAVEDRINKAKARDAFPSVTIGKSPEAIARRAAKGITTSNRAAFEKRAK